MPSFYARGRFNDARGLSANPNYASNNGQRDGEHGGCNQRAERVDSAKRKVSEVAQRSYSEGGNSVACLIEGDDFTRRHGRESWKLMPAETDTQREESRTAKARKTESNDAAGFSGGARDYLERYDQ